MNALLEIYCDESGLTGRNLLDNDQRLFTYAGVAVGDAEAWQLLRDLREKHMVLDDELKAKNLLKTARGAAFVLDLLQALEGRYSIVVYDKAVALCAKLVEYIYEPVFQADAAPFYARNLHRFITMYAYSFLTVGDELGHDAVRQFLAFMKSYDPAVAPLLFSHEAEGFAGNPFEMVTKFANGYRERIVRDNQSERDANTVPGTLTLDVSTPALFSLLCQFGESGRPLAVTCDENPQLAQVADNIIGGKDDPSIQRIREMHPSARDVGFDLARPIGFRESRDSPALQIADLIAGAAGACGSGRTAKRGLEQHLELVDKHLNPDAMLPDFSVVRASERDAMINWAVLSRLGDGAGAGVNPHFLLHSAYAEADRAWARGELRPAELVQGETGER